VYAKRFHRRMNQSHQSSINGTHFHFGCRVLLSCFCVFLVFRFFILAEFVCVVYYCLSQCQHRWLSHYFYVTSIILNIGSFRHIVQVSSIETSPIACIVSTKIRLGSKIDHRLTDRYNLKHPSHQ
jgi:hypothetical protein